MSKVRIVTCVTSIGLATLLAGCQSAPKRAVTPVPESEIAAKDARHLTTDGRTFVSGVLTRDGLAALHARGVQTVIDLRLPSQVPKGYEQMVHELGMAYVARPMHSDRMSGSDAGRVLESVEKHDKQPMLIQCGSSNRAGAIYGLYRAKTEGLRTDDAIDLAKEAGMRNKELEGDVRKYLESSEED